MSRPIVKLISIRREIAIEWSTFRMKTSRSTDSTTHDAMRILIDSVALDSLVIG